MLLPPHSPSFSCRFVFVSLALFLSNERQVGREHSHAHTHACMCVCVCVMAHGNNTEKDEERGDKGNMQDDNEQGMGYSCLCGAASYILTCASPPLLLSSLLRTHRPHVTAQTTTRLPPSSSTHARILTFSFRVSQRWAYACTCACTDVLRKDRASSTGNRSRYTR